MLTRPLVELFTEDKSELIISLFGFISLAQFAEAFTLE